MLDSTIYSIYVSWMYRWLQSTTQYNFTKRSTIFPLIFLLTLLVVYSHDFEWAILHYVVLDSKYSFHFDTQLLCNHLKGFVIPNCCELSAFYFISRDVDEMRAKTWMIVEWMKRKREKREEKNFVSTRTKMFESFPSGKIIKRESNLPAAFR